MAERRDIPILLAILLFALLPRVWFLSYPAGPVFDEIHYPPAAADDLAGLPDSNPVHPPLGKLVMAVGMEAWWGLDRYVLHTHSDAVAWRLGSLVLGLATIALTYVFALALFHNRRTATLSALLLSLDLLHIVQSRMAMLDMYEAFWILLGLYGTWRYIEGDTRWLWWASIAFGCGVATKWSTMFAMVGALAAVTLLKSPRQACKALGVGLLVTVAVYILSYLPMARAESIEIAREDATPALAGRLQAPVGAPNAVRVLYRIAAFHRLMWEFRHDPSQFWHPDLSPWWQWPLCIRPVWYLAMPKPATVQCIIALPTVWTWWPFLLVLALVLGAGRPRSPDARARLFCVLGYVPQVVLWALNPGFLFYMLPCLPLMYLLLGDQACRLGRGFAAGYLALCAVGTALYWPLLVAWPVPHTYCQSLMLGRWWM